MASNKLTPKQDKFCREYQVDRNATQAAVRAGYSEKTAAQQGARLLSNAKVGNRITKLSEGMQIKTGVKAERVVLELSRIAFFDIRKLFDSEGGLIPVKDLDEDTARALAGVEVVEMTDGSVKTKVRTIDKAKSLETLSKHLGLLVDRISHEGNVGNVVIMIPDNNRNDGANNGVIDPA